MSVCERLHARMNAPQVCTNDSMHVKISTRQPHTRTHTITSIGLLQGFLTETAGLQNFH